MTKNAGTPTYREAQCYAWGRQDTGAEEYDTPASWRFAETYAERCHVGSRPNLRAAYEEWRSTGKITAGFNMPTTPVDHDESSDLESFAREIAAQDPPPDQFASGMTRHGERWVLARSGCTVISVVGGDSCDGTLATVADAILEYRMQAAIMTEMDPLSTSEATNTYTEMPDDATAANHQGSRS